MTIEGFAPAKINLTLHVTGQRTDGYHLLDSLVAFVDVGDRLWFKAGNEMQIEVTGPFANGVPTDARNLAWQAAELAGWTGLIRLEKNLPHGAGIGSGSSDAAAVMRAFGGAQKALTLGADVPVCLDPVPQRMSGIGEILQPLHPLPKLQVLLVNPNVIVPTGLIFKQLTSKQNSAMSDELPEFTSAVVFCQWLCAQRNDLEKTAMEIAPQIKDVLQALSGAMLARMSGSGATCFGLYHRGVADVAKQISRAHPNWWVATGDLLS